MPNSQKFHKNLRKKINLVFFVEEKKTYHYKINHLLFKCLVISFFVGIVFLIGFSILGIKTLKENKLLSEYILSLKTFYIHDYFENHFNLGSQDEHNEEIAKAPQQVALAPNKKEATISPAVTKTTSDSKKASANLLDIAIEKQMISSQNNKISLSFILLNTSKIKSKSITGYICAQLDIIDTKGKINQANYPNKYVSDSNGNPTTQACSKGEYVKFSRLRPTTLTFETPYGFKKAQKMRVFFLEKNMKSPILIEEKPL